MANNEESRGITVAELRKVKAFENLSEQDAIEKCKLINDFARFLLRAVPYEKYVENLNCENNNSNQ